MTGIFKALLRTVVILGVIGAVGLGGMLMVAGQERTAAVLGQVQSSIVEHIDLSVDDPSAIRSQIRKLPAEYPERISQVRGDLAEISREIRELEKEQSISERVVNLAEEDLAAFQPLVEAATENQLSSMGSVLSSTIRFENRIYTLDQAIARTNQIHQTRIAHTNRAADTGRDLVYLRQQDERLGKLLLQLETERGQFEAQLVQLDRQVDAVARNDRLIELMGKRQKTFEECSRYEAASLDHITNRLKETLTRQEAELDFLANDQSRIDYEELARMQLMAEDPDAGVNGVRYETLPALPAGIHELTPVR